MTLEFVYLGLFQHQEQEGTSLCFVRSCSQIGAGWAVEAIVVSGSRTLKLNYTSLEGKVTNILYQPHIVSYKYL